ncbi:MAG: pilin [Candidatus Saccharimonadales bacterium]|nr:pilin [Candidatus Saccharimonadales bacterium]
MQLLKIKKTLLIISSLLLLSGMVPASTNLIFTWSGTAYAQTQAARSVCGSIFTPNTPPYDVCLTAYAGYEQDCEDAGGGDQVVQECLDGIPERISDRFGIPLDPEQRICEETGGVWVPFVSGEGGTCDCRGSSFGIDFSLERGCHDASTSTNPGEDPPGFIEADDRPKCPDGTPGVAISGLDPNNPNAAAENDHCLEFDENTASLEDNPIFTYLGIVINFLLGGVGIALVTVIVIGGYQYMTSRGDPQKVTAAKKKIAFAVVGMIMFLLSAAFLDWLVPGGLID